jgi:alkanesulfonate monooxygenase SsuD/methylene tetrahydromethanopterin reductase-like flavin-dependent oxidoreductase (luciferase family)
VKVGYLLPTRENIMRGTPSGVALLDAAKRAADLGYDSIWAGDSVLARPRHDALALLAGVAGAVPDVAIGTAVLLPALRNPVLLAQQLATVDQISGGRLIVGVGIAADTPTIRHEFQAVGVPFEGRVGRMMEGLRLMKALWSGEAVDWAGRWQVQQGILAPVPVHPEGPPIWLGTGARAGIERAARHFDGWFPIGPDLATFTSRRQHFLATAASSGRKQDELNTALYLTLAVDKDADRADRAIDAYMESYYGVPAAAMRKVQACFGGPLQDVVGFIRAYVEAGAQHLILRIVGEHEAVLGKLAAKRDEFC